MTTRTGKIARLPRAIREQLNRRLRDGEMQSKLVEWLNSLPETLIMLAAEFEGRPVNEQNLSEWKAGGYRDWVALQESLEMIRELSDNTTELRAASDELLTDKLAVWLAARYIAVARTLSGADNADAEQWRRLREFCSDVVALRKGDHSQERLKLERDHVEIATQEMNLKRDGAMEVFFEQLGKEMKAHPEIRSIVDSLHESLIKIGFEKQS
jgi:hypothetical protein